jgi:GT2 family glycosyltransferase
MAKVAVYTFTRDRLDYTMRTIDSMRAARPGHKYDHWVFDQGSEDGTLRYVRSLVDMDRIHTLVTFGENVGLHVGKNRVHDALLAHDYTHIMKVDNDIEFKTKHWLRKLLRAQAILKEGAVVSPVIRGLSNPVQPFASKRMEGYSFDFVEILGGAARLTTRDTIASFRYNERMPMAMGAATTFANHCMRERIHMAYVHDVVVKHMYTTVGQLKDKPEYFSRSEMERVIPYGL